MAETHEDGENNANFLARIHSSSFSRLTILWTVYYALVGAAFSAVWAGPIALIESTSYNNAFLFELTLFTGSIFPLTDWVPSDGAGLVIITNLLAVAHQIILAVFVGISAGPMIEGLIEIPNLSFVNGVDPEGTLLVSRTGKGFCIKIVIFYLAILSVCCLFSLLWGGLLAWAEGFAYDDGFVTALGVATSSLTANMPADPPSTILGQICGFYIGVIGAKVLGITIALASVPLLGIDISYDKSPVVRFAPMHFLSKEQRKKLGLQDKYIATPIKEASGADEGA